ncbi:MAG TPA: hypothetical protein VF008_25160 [Niastella sp.]
MTNASRFILFLCLLTSNLALKSQEIDELSLLNLSIDSTYNLNSCFQIIKPPYYKCCDQDTLSIEKLVECCKQSPVPQQFRVDCFRCINQQEFDTMTQLMIVYNTISSFDITKDKKYLMNEIGKKSKFYLFVKNFRKAIPPRKYDIDSLHQGRIRFLTREDFDNENRKYRFGKYGNQMLLGQFTFSRMYIDNNKGLAMFITSWLGSGECGYDLLILLSRQNGTWKYEQRILLGIY